MSVTIHIPDELAAKVEVRARARGMKAETYVTSLLEDAVGSVAPHEQGRGRDMAAFFEAMAAGSDQIPQLPDEAFTRESFYRDHD